MSLQDMVLIAEYLDGDNKAILRYCEITQEGTLDKLISTVSLAFSLKWDTAREKIKVIKSSGMIKISGNMWKWSGKDTRDIELLKQLKHNPDSVLTEEQKDEANRLKYRAPQEGLT